MSIVGVIETEKCMKTLTMNKGKMDTHMNVYIKCSAKPVKSTSKLRKTCKRKIVGRKETISSEKMDTPDKVFKLENGKTMKTGRFEKKKSKKSSKFPEKYSKNPLIFSCISLII